MPIPNNWKKEDILKLTLIKGLSYSTHKRVVESFGSFDDLMANLPDYLIGKLSNNSLFDDSTSADELLDIQLNALEKYNISFVTRWCDSYPSNLLNIDLAPTVLFFRGELPEQEADCISIVGTRKNTLYGRLTTEKFANVFAEQGITVVSGLAYGVDTIAHQTTIKAKGKTIAVVASGIDSISPSYSEKLAEEIVDGGGAVISEYKCEVKAKPGYFPQRNRIISGISVATIVIESDLKGGSLITTRFANDQGREVFAVPGPISSAKSAGCNKLIFDSLATIALSPESVLLSLGVREESKMIFPKNKISFKDDNQKIIYDTLSDAPRHIDDIAEETGLDISEILVKLLELEFKGYVRQLPGKSYIIM